MRVSLSMTRLLLVCALLAMTPACESKDSASHLDYGIYNTSYLNSSTLLLIARNRGSLNVCIAFADQDVDNTLLPTLKNATDQAINEWNSVLATQSSPQWPYGRVNINFTVLAYQQCPVGNSVNLNVFMTTSGWNGEVERHFGPGVSLNRAFALIHSHTINGLPEYAFGNVNNWFYIVRHEYGHLLGVSDTYSMAGSVLPYNQPAAAMKEYGRPLMEDDKAAIRALWSTLNTGRVECGPGYQVGNVVNNYSGTLFCVPAGSSTSPAGGGYTPTASYDRACYAMATHNGQTYREIIDRSRWQDFYQRAINAGYRAYEISYSAGCY